ncbi:Eco57I restriction-modification methylase domain-containing protein [Fluviicola sp.]|uniref:Eco57I restriction-modification methylase domain-containing protein n=1 Tax=Fluviicola sp. TaxID=1917219 RepID=UPI003D2E491C
MPLFQKTVLKKHLQELNSSKIDAAYQKFTAYFQNSTIQQNIRNAKEEQFQEGFLRELFGNILDYTLNPNPDFNLTTELKNTTNSKKADGAILVNNQAVAVIELKGTETTDLNKIEVQAFGYKNNQSECSYVITSNFEKLRFYIDNTIDFEEFNLFTLTREQFNLLYLCLSYENITNNIPKRLKAESVSQEDQISKKLYKDYSEFKRALYNNLVELNPQYDKLLLFKKTQKLLDRFLFIFFAEDTLLLPTNLIFRINQEWKILQTARVQVSLYERYIVYFNDLNHGAKVSLPAFGKKTGEPITEEHEIFAYNGGLFLPDEVLDNVRVDDTLLHSYSEKLSHYDFDSDVDVNILGHIFENSLNEIDEIKSEIEGTALEKTKTRRKKDGVFYTPKYITKYIVDNTIGKLCEEKKAELKLKDKDYINDKKLQNRTKKPLLDKLAEYREWLLQLTICDPACGSGAFLNQALDFLIAEHRYVDELQAKLMGDALILSDIETSILENNIYGVDLNDESVEIAKLSLWLRTAQKGRKLNSLNNNIKCGNSLIDDPAVAGDKAFSWENEFPEVFAKGGFDVVIGNPPYVDLKSLLNDVVKYLFENFESANNRVNLYACFIEKSVELINSTGEFSFIIPSSILTQESYLALRGKLLNEVTIQNIVRLPNESFGAGAGEVKVDTIILTFKNGVQIGTEADILIYKGFNRISDISIFNSDIYFKINSFEWKRDKSFIFRINADDNSNTLISKCEEKSKKMIECADFCLGLTPYDKYKGHTQAQIESRVFHSTFKKDNTFKKLLAGNDISRYYVSWGEKEWISYGEWLGASRESKFFKSKRILVKQIIDWTDKRIWSALTSEELYNTQNAFNLIAKSDYLPEYLIALINSKLISYYHKKKFLEEFKDRFQKILIKDAKEFPVKSITISKQKEFIKPIELIIKLSENLEKTRFSFLQYIATKNLFEKPSRKIENWYNIEFADFIKELNKAIKTSGGTPLTKKDEFEWMELFEENKKKALELKAEIDKTDKEIDQMVYELYGLSEEEIRIVERV